MAVNAKTNQWWTQAPVTKFGTTEPSIILSTGVIDIEKGAIFDMPAGTPIAVPVAAKVAWKDSQHVVLQTAQGVLNFLHVNPTVQVGSDLQPGQPFGVSSPLVGSYRDPTSGTTYTETGGVIEVGWYDSIKRAISRENFTAPGGKDNPTDFTGIFDPTTLFQAWSSGSGRSVTPGNSAYGTTDIYGSGMAGSGSGSGSIDWKQYTPWLILGAVILALVMIFR